MTSENNVVPLPVVEPENPLLPGDPGRKAQAEEALVMYKSNLKKARLLVNLLPKNGLARVCKALLEFPIGENYPNLKKQEQELFALTMNVNSAKNILVEYFDSNRKEVVKNLEVPVEGANGQENS